MKKIIFFIFIFPSLLFAAANPETFVIVSIDALHPDAVKKENCPNIWKIIENSFYTPDGKSVSPPKTLLSHAAMFTGMSPGESGITDNTWQKGEKQIQLPTIFDMAKEAGYRTGYFYAKEKLGFLKNKAVDYAKLSKIASIHYALEFLKETEGKVFTFVHVSGLDKVGPRYGWLSKEYLEEFYYIDQDLKPMIDYLHKRDDVIFIITSDHAGHDKIHGSNHPEDKKLPLIIYDSEKNYDFYKNRLPYFVTDLFNIIDKKID